MRKDIGHAFINSLIIAIPGTILPVLVAAFAAYAFAWMKFPGRDWIFLGIVALLVVPIQITLIPVLTLSLPMSGSDGQLCRHLAGAHGLGLPFAIYLLRSFFGALPLGPVRIRAHRRRVAPAHLHSHPVATWRCRRWPRW